ncbi:hypothetical protein GHT06_014618 [Daphnia sinensis]|uniref:ANK_REP_REGION domain-containing protein n=1 Tax=Daphnia sinensis TaxID=1820382 RepID=A0AAD5PSJ6_9CRUS|nr:hypothetical protein GHT06_014618 [Daphnia sinensis]
MTSSTSVFDLFFHAVKNDLIDELQEIRIAYGLKAITTSMIGRPCNERGDTALQVAVSGRHFAVFEFLMSQLKLNVLNKQREHRQVCPKPSKRNHLIDLLQLYAAEIAIIRDVAGQVPITKMIESIDPFLEKLLWVEIILNSIMASSAAKSEKIVTLELMGVAFIVNQSQCEILRSRGLECWKEALCLRSSTSDGGQEIPKIPYVLPHFAHNGFEDATEFVTVKQLEKYEKKLPFVGSLEDWRSWRDSQLRIQALLVNQRIMVQSHHAGPSYFHLKHLWDYADNFWNHKQYSDVIKILLLILEQSSGFNLISSFNCIYIFLDSLQVLSQCFQTIYQKPLNSPEREKLSVENLLISVKFGSTIARLLPIAQEHLKRSTYKLNIMMNVYDIVSLLVSMRPQQSWQETQQLKRCLCRYFRLDGWSHLLFFPIERLISFHSRYPSGAATQVKIVQLFLEAGADPNITNENGKTPLHILSESLSKLHWNGMIFPASPLQSYSTFFYDVFKALLDSGYHLDLVTRDKGRTVLSILRSQPMCLRQAGALGDLKLNELINSLVGTVLPLSCYCAQTIRHHRIPFEDQLPPRLQEFVHLHVVKDQIISISSQHLRFRKERQLMINCTQSCLSSSMLHLQHYKLAEPSLHSLHSSYGTDVTKKREPTQGLVVTTKENVVHEKVKAISVGKGSHAEEEILNESVAGLPDNIGVAKENDVDAVSSIANQEENKTVGLEEAASNEEVYLLTEVKPPKIRRGRGGRVKVAGRERITGKIKNVSGQSSDAETSISSEVVQQTNMEKSPALTANTSLCIEKPTSSSEMQLSLNLFVQMTRVPEASSNQYPSSWKSSVGLCFFVSGTMTSFLNCI